MIHTWDWHFTLSVLMPSSIHLPPPALQESFSFNHVLAFVLLHHEQLPHANLIFLYEYVVT